MLRGMPLFVLIGRDGEKGPEHRLRHRAAHLAGLEPLDRAGRIRHAGPLLDAGGTPRGSVVLFEAASLDDAQALMARDPYVLEGVFESWEVHETRATFPAASPAAGAR
jgi:uncharacterized protein YciI